MNASPFLAALLLATAAPASAQDSADAALDASASADLAQQLANPIASLVQVPVSTNLDFGWGLDGGGFRYTANIQPVVPISLNADWNLISRTIVPVIAQDGVTSPETGQFGLGDTVQSLFFSPRAASSSGNVWGAGPVFLVPTATDRVLGTGKWGVGPSGVILKIAGQSTYGVLVNHIWSIAGTDNRNDVSASFAQPFYTYTTRTAMTFGISTEVSYDWLGDNWLAPVNLAISQLVVLGKQPVSFQGGFRYFVASPAGGPDWGLRLGVTLLFPK
ncbi:MAG: hypothetical protein ACRC1J_10605 [Sandaracinobacteroides sp.]